jgi:hypothetical protein
MANINPLENPYQVHFIGKGRESNGQWHKSKTISSTNNSTNPLKLNWTSITTSGDGKIVMACINNGQVYLSSQYGYDLVAVTALPTAAWSCIRVSTDGTLAVACIMGGGIFVGNFDGSIWNWIDSGAITAQWSSVAISNNKLSIIACIYNKDSYPYGVFLANYSANWTWTQPNGWNKNAYLTSITFSGDNLTIATCPQSTSNNGPNISIFNTSTNEWGPLNVSATFPNNYYWTSITKFGSSKNFVACVNGIGIFTAIYNENPITPVWGWTQTSAPTAAWTSIASDSTGQYVIACVNGGGIYSSWDYGSSWQLQDTNGLPATASWSAVAYGNTCSNVVACATNDYIYVSPSFQGIVWNSSFGLNRLWVTVASDSTGQNLIAGVKDVQGTGFVYISHDYGITWENANAVVTAQNWNYVTSNYNGSILGAVIYYGGTCISIDSGTTWFYPVLESVVNAEKCSQMSFNNDGTFGVISSLFTNNESTSGKLYVSNDTSNDSSWVETIPTNPPESVNQWRAVKFSGNGSLIYATSINNLSQSFIYKGEYNSGDNTCSWTPVFSSVDLGISPPEFSNITCSVDGLYVAAINPKLGNTSTNIWLSSDSGANWISLDDLTNPPIFYPSLTPLDASQDGYGFQGLTMTPDGKKLAITYYTSTPYQSKVYVSFNYGETWFLQTESLPQTANAWKAISTNSDMSKLILSAFSGASGYGGSSGLFTGHISITSWTSQQNGLPTLAIFRKLAMSNNGKYIAVSAAYDPNFLGGIWISLDYGQTWSQSDAGNLSWNAIGCDNTGQYLVAAVTGGSIYTSSNYGLNWTIQSASSGLPTTANWDSISFSSNSDPNSTSQFVYASIYDGYIYFSEDRGLTWTQINLNSYWSNGITSSGDGNIGYYGINWPVGGIYKTIQTNPITISQINGTGGYWNYLSCDSTGQYLAAVFTDLNGDYLNTSYGIYINNNYGNSSNWTQIASKALYWNSVSLINMGNYLLITAICINGLIYTCNYSISTPIPSPLYTWTLQGKLPASYWNDIKSTILPSGEAQLVMCSLNGGIWLSSDSGANWSQSTLPYNYQNMPAITSSSIGQNQVAIINNTPPYISTNYGLNWNQLINTGLPSTEGWYSIASSLTCQYIVLSTVIGAIYVSFNYGQSWVQYSYIGAYPLLSMSSSGKIIAAASVNGTIYKSIDYGFSWLQLTILNGLPSASEAWSSIALSNNGQFMIASINGGKIYKSADYGQSWTLINSPLAAWSSVAISSTGQCMLACINGGKIYGSTDFGETLNIINNTNANWSSLAISGSGQNIVATINGGLIYGSSDFGSTWSQINSTTVANWKSITSSISGQYLAAINSNSTETNIYINSNFMDIGNVLSSLITQLQIEIQCNSEQAPTGSSVYYLGTTDPNGWVIMDGQPRQNNGEYNNLITLGIGTTSNNNTIYTPPNTGVNWILKL